MASEEEVVIDLREMKVADLKKELQLRGLKVSGNKQELIERLQQYLEEHEGAEVDDEILKEEEEGETDDHLADQKVGLSDADLTPAKDSVKKEEEKAEESPQVEQNEEVKDVVASLQSAAGLTDAEKLKIRAEKFGMTVSDMNTDARKAARSERFGTGSAVGGAPAADADKLKKRAERFGGVVSDGLNRTEDEERRRKRLARFALNASADSGTEDVDKKKKRAERFGLVA